MTTLAQKAREASFPTQLRSPEYEERLKADEERKAQEASGTKDPGVAGSGYVPPPKTAAGALMEAANQQTAVMPQPTTNEAVQKQVREEVPLPELDQQGAGRLVGMTPGGWIPAQRSKEQSVTGPRFSPETEALYNQAALMEAQARRNEAHVEGGRNLAMQSIEERRAQQEAIYAEGRQKREAMHQKVYAARRQKLDDLERDVADDKVDPRRLFKNMDAGHLALFGLGGILASLGAGYSAAAGHHGTSPFIEQMRFNIQNDIASQENEIAGKERGVERAANALDALQRTFGDRETAVLALENLQLKAYENATKQMMLKYDNTSLAPKLQLANAQLVKMLADNRMKMEAMSKYSVDAKAADVFAPPKPIYAGGGPSSKKKYGWSEYRDMDEASRTAVKEVQKQVIELKIPDSEDKLADLLAAVGGVDKNQLSSLVNAGDPGAVRRYISQQLAGDKKAQARLSRFTVQDYHDLFGATTTEGDRARIAGSTGENFDPERMGALAESVQESINRRKSIIQSSGPAGAWVLDNYNAQRRKPKPGQLGPTGTGPR